jgi:hypothetical protein
MQAVSKAEQAPLQIRLTSSAILIIGIALIVIGLWGVFGLHNGFSGETGLIYTSDLLPGFEGFFYSDPLRKFTSLFYHLSYLIGAAVRETGSFVPYQIVYGSLWALRALLAALIVQKLVPGRPALAAFAAVFAALDTSDAAVNWVGQLNQFGFIFLMLLSFFLFLRSLESKGWAGGACSAMMSAAAGYLALWSYESPLPVMLAFPLAVATLRRDFRFARLLLVSAIYLIPVVVFVKKNAERYLASGANLTYQASVTRPSFSLASILSDLWFHLKNSIAFWNWPQAYFDRERIWHYALALLPVVIGIALVVPRAVSAENRCARPFRIDLQLVKFVGVSFCLLVASYLVVLLLSDNRQLWRTEFLGSFAAPCLMAASVYALLSTVRRTSVRVIMSLAAFGVVGTFATYAGVNSALKFHLLWERQRVLLASLIASAPRVADGTLFVVQDIDPKRDPFGHNMWLDLALRLAYPETRVAGIYTFVDGHSAPGMNIDIRRGEPHVVREGFPTLFHSTSGAKIDHIVAFNFNWSSGEAVPISRGPIKIGAGEIAATRYDFCGAIAGATPDPIAVRRYGPIAGADHLGCGEGARR